jgi:hypothetical protein
LSGIDLPAVRFFSFNSVVLLLENRLDHLPSQGILSMPIVATRDKRFYNGFVDLADITKFISRTFIDGTFTNFEEFDAVFQQPSLNSWRTVTVGDLIVPDERAIAAGVSLLHAVETMARCAFNSVVELIGWYSVGPCPSSCLFS